MDQTTRALDSFIFIIIIYTVLFNDIHIDDIVNLLPRAFY